jgi:hypothetical protein
MLLLRIEPMRIDIKDQQDKTNERTQSSFKHAIMQLNIIAITDKGNFKDMNISVYIAL